MSGLFVAPLALVLLAFGLHWVLVTHHQGLWTLDSLCVVYLTILAAGTYFIPLDPNNGVDREYAWVVTVPMVIYTITSVALFGVYHRRNPRIRKQLDARRVLTIAPTRTVTGLTFLSVAITVLYFWSVGFNAFLLGIRNALGGHTTQDFQQLRVDAYAGTKYLFPGYVNQFKNCILPAMTFVIVAWLFANKRTGRLFISLVLVVITLLGVLGNGQRGAFVLIVLTLLMFVFHIDPGRFKGRALSVVLVALPTFILATYFNGRSASEIQQSKSSFGALWVLLNEVYRRAFVDNQQAGQVGYRYTTTQHIQPGSDWLNSISGILPGRHGTKLPAEIFKIQFGSDVGTAPPSLWGSVSYNFGWLGLILVPVLMALTYRWLTNKMIDPTQINTLEIVGFAGFSAVTGAWIAGGPEYLLNAGAVTFAIIWWLGRRLSKRTARIKQTQIEDSFGNRASRRKVRYDNHQAVTNAAADVKPMTQAAVRGPNPRLAHSQTPPQTRMK